jgi:hypothetical protein
MNLLYLNTWKDQLRNLKDRFDGIKFMHVHMNFNTEAYTLSKRALDYRT